MKRKAFTLKFKCQVLEYLKTHTGMETSRFFGIDPRRIRQWKNIRNEIEESARKAQVHAKRIIGAGRKVISEEMEAHMVAFILDQRSQSLRVSRKMIQIKALKAFSIFEDGSTKFVASTGWLRRFMNRNGFSLRRRTTVAQKDPDEVFVKLVSYIGYVSELQKKYNFSAHNIYAMDETSVVFDLVSNTTVAVSGSNDVPLKSTGNEKLYFTVVLAASGSGVKLKPYVVFKKSKREVEKLQQEEKNAVIASSQNGWMNNDLTINWLDKVFRQFSFAPRLLAWDAYRCHLTDSVKKHVHSFNTKLAVVPGGCTKYIQAPDVSWNKSFKASMTVMYDAWMAGKKDKQYTKPRVSSVGGRLKPPSKKLITSWVIKAWDSIPEELIVKSFKICALTIDKNGADDHEIHCLKEGQPCRAAWEMLLHFRDHNLPGYEPIVEEDEEQMELNEIIIDEETTELAGLGPETEKTVYSEEESEESEETSDEDESNGEEESDGEKESGEDE